MKKSFKSLIALSIFLSIKTYSMNSSCCGVNTCGDCTACGDCNSCCIGKCDGYPLLLPRSQGQDEARRLVMTQQFVNRYDMDSTYGAFSIIPEYSQSFNSKSLSHFLFGSDLVNCNQLYIQGSQVENRNSKAWLADYFGLPTDYQSKISFSPKIQNAILDINFYVGLDELAEGLFFKINFPLVWTKWTLCPSEEIVDSGVNGFSAGYMSTYTIAREDLAPNFLSTMNGGYKFGDMQTPIKAGKFINKCDCSVTRLAQVDLALGWNFVLENNHHFGIFLCAVAPTGNRPVSHYIFEPLAGNGKHWEFGAGITGSWIFHQSQENPDRYAGLWFNWTATHLFNSCQCRTFDFCSKPSSRYMLLEEMGNNNNNINAQVNGDDITASQQYNRSLIPAVNWSTFPIDVRIDVQTDAAIKFGFVIDNWTFDLGYNFWARSGEKFCNDKCSCDAVTKIYSIKGDTWVYGVIRENDVETTKYPLSASQSQADIHSGKNYPAVDSDNPLINPRIDSPYPAKTDNATLYAIGTTSQINTSINPVILTRKNLNLGKGPGALSNSAFWNFGYAWKDHGRDYMPFISLGGKIEFAQNNYKDCQSCQCYNNSSCNSCSCTTGCNNSSCNNSCSSCCQDCCPRGGVSQWSIWLKGGLAFD